MPIIPLNRVFVIAEMANSHEGNLNQAKKITEHAALAGANAIKFQKFTALELAEPGHEDFTLYKKLEMNQKEWEELIRYAKSKNLKVFVDVFGVQSVKAILDLDIDGYKIHSADLSNPILLKFLANENKPILLSTAGSILNEVDEALKILLKVPKEIVLMHGFQGYPTKIEDTNLLRISELKKRFYLPVGIMDHISGDSEMAKIIPLLGVSLGAKVVEKHLTLDRSKKGLDYYSALNPKEFGELISLIRMTEKSLGSHRFDLSKNELSYRLSSKKNPISKQFIKKGTILREEMFVYKRTKVKQDVPTIYEFRKRQASKDIAKGVTLIQNMVSNKPPKVAAIIACRIDSSRLFGKPLQPIGNFSMLQLVLNQIRKSKMVDEIVLAISEKPGNEVFVDFAKKQKIKFILGDDNDVLKRLIDGAKYVNADIVFRLTPDCPYIYWEGFDSVIKKHINGNFDFSIIIDVPLGSACEVINLSALEFSHLHGSERHRSELCSLYINENENKFKIFKYRPPKKLQRPELRLTVDTPQDLMVARIIYDKIGRKGESIPLEEIIKFLDKNPEVVKINSNVPLGVSRIWIPDDPLR